MLTMQRPATRDKTYPDKELAKRIIVDVVCQANGISKASLHTAFYLAHLYYSKDDRGFLSDWPIIRFSQGPGIQGADALLEELIAGGRLSLSYREEGPFSEVVYQVADNRNGDDHLSVKAAAAIRKAVEFVAARTPESLAQVIHKFARSWKDADDSAELHLYCDLIPDDRYAAGLKDAANIKNAYDELFGKDSV